MSQPKRHHFVPKAYLDRFAVADKVLVRRRGGRVFSANPINVAVESGFYDLISQSGHRSSEVEHMLADLDGEAIEALRRVDRRGCPPEPGTGDRQILARFLALQTTRTPEQRERVEFPARLLAWANGADITLDAVRTYLRQIHLKSTPSDREVQAAFDYVTIAMAEPKASGREFSIGMMLKSVASLAPVIAGLHWTLEVDRKQQLITSDVPLVIWRRPSPRDRFEGVGLTNADELRFVLDPGQQLVLTRRTRTATARITAERARACSADAGRSCHNFVVGSPRQSSLIRGIPLSAHRPVLRFNIGPMYVPSAGGLQKTDKEVLHTWIQRRG